MNKHVWTPLNKEMTDALFRANAVLLGSVDRVPDQKALELTCKPTVITVTSTRIPEETRQ